METIEEQGTFEEMLADSSPRTKEIAKRLRTLIAEVHPEVVEVVWARQGNAGYGLGPKKTSEHYAYIGPHKTHVNLGFNWGAELDDPEGLLEGTGVSLRHVKVRSMAEAENPALRALLEAAVAERRAALGR